MLTFPSVSNFAPRTRPVVPTSQLPRHRNLRNPSALPSSSASAASLRWLRPGAISPLPPSLSARSLCSRAESVGGEGSAESRKQQAPNARVLGGRERLTLFQVQEFCEQLWDSRLNHVSRSPHTPLAGLSCALRSGVQWKPAWSGSQNITRSRPISGLAACDSLSTSLPNQQTPPPKTAGATGSNHRGQPLRPFRECVFTRDQRQSTSTRRGKLTDAIRQ